MCNISASVMRSLLNLCSFGTGIVHSVHSQEWGGSAPFGLTTRFVHLEIFSLVVVIGVVQQALQIQVSMRVPCAPQDCSVWTTCARLLSAHHCSFLNLLLPLPWHCSLYGPSQNNHAKPTRVLWSLLKWMKYDIIKTTVSSANSKISSSVSPYSLSQTCIKHSFLMLCAFHARSVELLSFTVWTVSSRKMSPSEALITHNFTSAKLAFSHVWMDPLPAPTLHHCTWIEIFCTNVQAYFACIIQYER